MFFKPKINNIIYQQGVSPFIVIEGAYSFHHGWIGQPGKRNFPEGLLPI